MGTEKVDLRVVKTRKAIKSSFIKLLNEKKIEKITIQDISKSALINRNTFYLHYLDKYDLMEQLCNENIKKINDTLNKSLNDNATEIFFNSLNPLFEIFKDNLVFFKAVLNNNKVDFIDNLKKTLKILFINEYDFSNMTVEQEIKLEYNLSGLVGIISFWIENQNIPIYDIVSQINSIHESN